MKKTNRIIFNCKHIGMLVVGIIILDFTIQCFYHTSFKKVFVGDKI